MKVSFISSSAVSDALRSSLLRMQSDLVKNQKEVATGRVADQGLALGAQTGRSVSLARDVERLDAIVDANSLISGRLTSTQDAIGQISDLAGSFLSTLTASVSGSASAGVVQQDGKATLSALTAIMNSNLNGEHLFAGINTDVEPMNAYDQPGSSAKIAFDAGFVSHFGFSQTDPAAANISGSAMQTFMDTVVQPQFLGSGWQTNWSNATDDAITARIALNETAQTSVSANNDGMRKLAMAATMITEMLSGAIGAGGRNAIVEEAVRLVGSAVADLSQLAAQTGIVQQRVASASERLDMQIDIFKQSINDYEAIDPYEASTRVTSLLAQIETSYALTARIQQLSLVRFLP